jgi:hypothetical protein
MLQGEAQSSEFSSEENTKAESTRGDISQMNRSTGHDPCTLLNSFAPETERK